MGKTNGSQDTTYHPTAQQNTISTGAINNYMNGDGTFKQPGEFDFNTNAHLQDVGKNHVAGFTAPQEFAFGQTLAHYGQQEPWMQAAQGMTFDAANPTGIQQNAPDGWQIDPATGRASYESYDQGVQRRMSPFTNDVVGATINDAMYGLGRANLATSNSDVSRGSFGGTRDDLKQSLNTEVTMRALIPQIAGLRQSGFNQAVGQYNTGFDQGERTWAANTGIEQANRAAELAAAAQGGSQAGQAQTLRGNDINAVNNVGAQYQQLDQAQRDAAFQDLMTRFGIPMQEASGLYGLTGKEGSTTTTSTSPYSSIMTGLGTGIGMIGSAIFSDERGKEGIEDADPNDSLAAIRKLKPKIYNYNDYAKAQGAPEGRFHGFMAQDMEKATGKEAPTMSGGLKGVDVMEHLGRLTHAVQALDAKVHSRRRAA